MKRAFVAAAGAALLTAAPGDAATVVIWPVDPVLSGAQQATALWLENKGEAPVTLQVRALAWTQADGRDETVDQDEVIASPPIAKVGPGQRQLVRIIRRQPAALTAERGYRLLIDELPALPDATAGTGASAQLSVRMRYSIPLFVQPTAAPAAPRLSASVRVSGAQPVLDIRNGGAGRARLTDIRVGRGARQVTVQSGLAGYVLSGATMSWPLPGGGVAEGVTVAVNGVDQTLLPSS